jgi:hypothetical protein
LSLFHGGGLIVEEVGVTNTEINWTEVRRRLDELFPTREHHLVWKLEHFARTGQTFDVTFLNREPILEVTLAQEFAFEFLQALSWGSPEQMEQLCQRIRFSDGSCTNLADIWILNYMPRDLDTSGADLSEGDQRIGDGGETVREMVSNIYHCRSRAEEDFFFPARFIAS